MPYDFRLSEEQLLFQREATRVISEMVSFDMARTAEDHGLAHVMDRWRRLGDLGYAGICAAEQHCGGELGLVELTLLAEQAGARAAPLPLVWHNAAVRSISRAADRPVRPELAAELASGRQIVTVAHLEAGDTADPRSIEAELAEQGGQFRLIARKTFVPFATIAQYFLATARFGDGYALALVPSESATVSPYRSTGRDGRAMVAVDATLSQDMLVASGDASIVEDLLGAVQVGLCGYATGASRAAMDMAVAYAKDRIIFGRALGSFQAVAHRAADMLYDVEGGQLLTLEAAWRIDSGRPAGDYVAGACAYVGAGSQRVLAHAHQIHGAIGFTFEHNLSLLSTVVKATAADLGREDVNQEKVAVALGI